MPKGSLRDLLWTHQTWNSGTEHFLQDWTLYYRGQKSYRSSKFDQAWGRQREKSYFCHHHEHAGDSRVLLNNLKIERGYRNEENFFLSLPWTCRDSKGFLNNVKLEKGYWNEENTEWGSMGRQTKGFSIVAIPKQMAFTFYFITTKKAINGLKAKVTSNHIWFHREAKAS